MNNQGNTITVIYVIIGHTIECHLAGSHFQEQATISSLVHCSEKTITATASAMVSKLGKLSAALVTCVAASGTNTLLRSLRRILVRDVHIHCSTSHCIRISLGLSKMLPKMEYTRTLGQVDWGRNCRSNTKVNSNKCLCCFMNKIQLNCVFTRNTSNKCNTIIMMI